jgi:predicted S18 family serine protease
MKKFLTIMAVLTSVATPALAQSSTNQIERSVPTYTGQTYQQMLAHERSDWSPFGPGDGYAGGAD